MSALRRARRTAPDAGRFYGVEDDADVAWMADRLTGHPWACFAQPVVLTDEAALWAIPRYHIVCSAKVPTRDHTMVEGARAAGRFWEIDTGHDLMITEPEFVADALMQVAQSR